MNLKFLLFSTVVFATVGCSTAYKNGQTPDDLYYSPAREVKAGEEEKEVRREETRQFNSFNDRQIVMSMYDSRWRYFNDDYHAFYDPYRYGYNCGYYYNPYYYPSPVFIVGAPLIDPKNTAPRTANLGSYNYSNMAVVNPKDGSTQRVRSSRIYNNSNSDKYIRRVITPERVNSNNGMPRENNTRTYSPSNNNSGSSPSRSGSSGAPVSRPGRRG